MLMLEDNLLTKEFKDNLTLDLFPTTDNPTNIDAPVIIDFGLQVCKTVREDGTKINVRTVTSSADAALVGNAKIYNPYAHRMLVSLRDKYGCSQFNMRIAAYLSGISYSTLSSESFRRGFMNYRTWRCIHDAILVRFGAHERWFKEFCELLLIVGTGYHPRRRYARREHLTLIDNFNAERYIHERRYGDAVTDVNGDMKVPSGRYTFFQAKEEGDMGYFISTDFNRNSVTHSIGENEVDVTNKEAFAEYIENWLDHKTTMYRGALWASQGAVSVSSIEPAADASEQVHLKASEEAERPRYEFASKYVRVNLKLDDAHDMTEYALFKQTEKLNINQLNDVFGFVNNL